jgi:hypothetical protein
MTGEELLTVRIILDDGTELKFEAKLVIIDTFQPIRISTSNSFELSIQPGEIG